MGGGLHPSRAPAPNPLPGRRLRPRPAHQDLHGHGHAERRDVDRRHLATLLRQVQTLRRHPAAGHLHGGVRRAAGRAALAAVAGPGAARHLWERPQAAVLQLAAGAVPGPPAAAAGRHLSEEKGDGAAQREAEDRGVGGGVGHGRTGEKADILRGSARSTLKENRDS